MINYNKVGRFANLKYSILQFYNKHKIKIFVLLFIMVLALLTGIFTAVKLTDLEKALKYAEFSFEALMDGSIYKFSFFMKRFGSILIVLALLIVFSLTKFLRPFGYILIGYRAFLLSLNITLIIMHMGMGGTINAVIIILPCQIIELLLMSLFFVVLIHMLKEKEQCGKINNEFFKHLLILIAVSFLVNVIELILLLIFKATTILII